MPKLVQITSIRPHAQTRLNKSYEPLHYEL